MILIFIYLLTLASSIASENRRPRTYLFNGRTAHWKTLHSVPHDLGDPGRVLTMLIFNAFIL